MNVHESGGIEPHEAQIQRLARSLEGGNFQGRFCKSLANKASQSGVIGKLAQWTLDKILSKQVGQIQGGLKHLKDVKSLTRISSYIQNLDPVYAKASNQIKVLNQATSEAITRVTYRRSMNVEDDLSEPKEVLKGPQMVDTLRKLGDMMTAMDQRSADWAAERFGYNEIVAVKVPTGVIVYGQIESLHGVEKNFFGQSFYIVKIADDKLVKVPMSKIGRIPQRQQLPEDIQLQGIRREGLSLRPPEVHVPAPSRRNTTEKMLEQASHILSSKADKDALMGQLRELVKDAERGSKNPITPGIGITYQLLTVYLRDLGRMLASDLIPQEKKEQALVEIAKQCVNVCPSGQLTKAEKEYLTLAAFEHCEVSGSTEGLGLQHEIHGVIQELKLNIINEIAINPKSPVLKRSFRQGQSVANESVHFVSGVQVYLGDMLGLNRSVGATDPGHGMFMEKITDWQFVKEFTELFTDVAVIATVKENLNMAAEEGDGYKVLTGQRASALIDMIRSELVKRPEFRRDPEKTLDEQFLNSPLYADIQEQRKVMKSASDEEVYVVALNAYIANNFFDEDVVVMAPSGINDEGVRVILQGMGILIGL